MRTNTPRHRAWTAASCVLALMSLPIGAALAAVPSTTAYYGSSHPMISGTVITLNDHQMIVDTDQGERVTLELDTRTMAPRNLAPGMVMRAEFLALEDCRFYVQRVIPVRAGTADRLQAYANTRVDREMVARSAPAFADDRPGSAARMAGADSRERMPQAGGEDPPATTMTAAPTTADHEFSARPMISGTVAAVSDHRLVLETDQGQQVGLVMDSRTMVPSEVAAGAALRVEFTQMKDGRYYAKRISRIGSGVAAREQAYAHTRDREVMTAASTADCGFVSAGTGNAASSDIERRGTGVRADEVLAQSAPARVVEKEETLPQTASNQALILLLGMLAVGSAAFVTVLRGFRTA